VGSTHEEVAFEPRILQWQNLPAVQKLGEGAMEQLTDEELEVQPNEASNSIALIVRHLSGNMLFRWTDFMTRKNGAIARLNLPKDAQVS
jgi:hypothetical protein